MRIINKHSSLNLTELVAILRCQQIIAYPTEAVFGLGCDPDSKSAVQKLLNLKKRSWQKGFILIAANYTQLANYINNSMFNDDARTRIFSRWFSPVTWIIPAHPTTPYWLTGQYSSLAIRISTFKPVNRLCLAFGKPLVSTSANLTGLPPARTVDKVREQFGCSFPIMNEVVEGLLNPSEIRDVLSGKLIR